jgi:fructoselysine-6-P-deglycase FrlB-like protein
VKLKGGNTRKKLRWQVHYWYGKALLDSGDKKAALKLLEMARMEAESLTAKEQQETKELLDRAQSK